MPGALLFGFFAVAHGCLALGALSLSPSLLIPALCLFVVEAVTAFDNGATVLGTRLGLGAAAEQLSRRRFLLHATCIGFLVPVYSGIAGGVALAPAAAAVGDLIAWVCVAAITTFGYQVQFKRLGKLTPVSALGCLRYAQAVSADTRWPGYAYSEAELNATAIPPLASIITVLIGLVYSAVTVWLAGFWVPLVATALMFVAGAFPQRGWGPVATSCLEIVFSSGILYSLWYAANLS